MNTEPLDVTVPWTYESADGESAALVLFSPIEVELDRRIRNAAENFAVATKNQRDDLRASMHRTNANVLLGYAGRAAVFGLRQRSTHWVRNGLMAMTMIPERRVDPRDVITTIARVLHAAGRLDMDLRSELRPLTEIADATMAVTLRSTIDRGDQFCRNNKNAAKI